MAIFVFDKIKIAGMACAIPKNVIRPDDFKEKFGEEEVEKFKQMTGITESQDRFASNCWKPLFLGSRVFVEGKRY